MLLLIKLTGNYTIILYNICIVYCFIDEPYDCSNIDLKIKINKIKSN